LTFEQKSDSWGFSSEDISHGMALADFDNDGDLDVVITGWRVKPVSTATTVVHPVLQLGSRETPPTLRG
jgi:hypothetical protein